MYDMFQDIKEEFISKAKLILDQKTMNIKEYNDKCGMQKMKSIILDNNLNREEKELQLKQLNEELNIQDKKDEIS